MVLDPVLVTVEPPSTAKLCADRSSDAVGAADAPWFRSAWAGWD
jgi:hypothetical protein